MKAAFLFLVVSMMAGTSYGRSGRMPVPLMPEGYQNYEAPNRTQLASTQATTKTYQGRTSTLYSKERETVSASPTLLGIEAALLGRRHVQRFASRFIPMLAGI